MKLFTKVRQKLFLKKLFAESWPETIHKKMQICRKPHLHVKRLLKRVCRKLAAMFSREPFLVRDVITTEYRTRVHCIPMYHLFCNALVRVMYLVVSDQCSHTIHLLNIVMNYCQWPQTHGLKHLLVWLIQPLCKKSSISIFGLGHDLLPVATLSR